ncbi:hypothetical protein K501DRAFT_337300 [Backusella circina FSU 941]|nr:hypothetical protein K501DRAFT_337300 [Backusella circina FSU 941]
MTTAYDSVSFLKEHERDEKHDFELERSETVRKSLWKTRNSHYLILTTIFEAIVVIILESILFAQYPSTDTSGLQHGIPVYLMLFIFSLVFQVLLVWDATRHKNSIQIIAFLIFNLCCFSYAVFQFKQIETPLSDPNASFIKLIIANPIVIGICQLIYLYLGTSLCVEFGWRIYKKIGADPEIRNMYRWYQIFLTILKLDIFFFLGFSIQYLVLVLSHEDIEYALTILALPLTCLLLLLAVYSVRHESKILISLFFVGLAAGVAYFIFKLYRIYTQVEKYQYVQNFLKFFVILTIINASICWYNFGKGLKPHLLQKTKTTKDYVHDEEAERTLSLD